MIIWTNMVILLFSKLNSSDELNLGCRFGFHLIKEGLRSSSTSDSEDSHRKQYKTTSADASKQHGSRVLIKGHGCNNGRLQCWIRRSISSDSAWEPQQEQKIYIVDIDCDDKMVSASKYNMKRVSVTVLCNNYIP